MLPLPRKMRRILAVLVAHLPANVLRLFLYRYLFGYSFGPESKIGFGSVIDVASFKAGRRFRLSIRNRFEGPMHVVIGDNVLIGKENIFSTGHTAGAAQQKSKEYARTLILENDVLVHEYHLFDVYGLIHVEEGSWIAGFRSQFLTHGLSVTSRDIVIGRNSYLGSGILVSPNSGVGERSIVAMGTVLTSRFSESNVVIGGVPARVLRERGEEDMYKFERGDW